MTISMEDLFEAGCHLGHPTQKWHPKMKPWLYGEQDGTHIFDLEKTVSQLEKVATYLHDLKANNKTLVVVATKKQAAELAEKLAIENGAMYVVNRWPGGLITNWEQVRRSIRRMNEIEDGLKTGKFKEYTKYERLMMEKELARLERLFGGLKALHNKPDALLVIDAQKEKNSVREAIAEKIDIIALVDSNTDPTGIKLPIPGNDDALSSVKIILTEVLRAYNGQAALVEKKVEAEKPAVTEEKPVTTEVKETVAKVEEKPVEAKKTVKKAVAKKVSTAKATEKKTTVKKPVVKKAAVTKKTASAKKAAVKTEKKVVKKEA